MDPTRGARLLVISDLHAHSEAPDPGGATSLSFHGSAEGVDKLFDGLKATLDKAGIRDIDVLVCPGDLSNQCDTTALPMIWRRLCQLADDLGAELVATAGNHDHFRGDGEPMRYLKMLDPPFPTRNEQEAAHYFAYHFTRSEIAGLQVVTINSAAFTGLRDVDGHDEYRHGRVSKETVVRLQRQLTSQPVKDAGVVVIHHHPVQLPDIDLAEASKIRDVEPLLEVLASAGPWLVVHGHKHRPWIQYAPGGGGSAVLFSAGSFAAGLDGVLAQSTKNQFYIVDLLPEKARHILGLGIAGTFQAWSHSPVEPDAWIPSGRGDGLPARGGFGWRADPARIARLLAEQLLKQQADLSWSDLLRWEERLQYITPDDWKKVEGYLTGSDARIRIIHNAEGLLERLTLLGERSS